MIDVTLFQNDSGDYVGFRMTGHAEYAEYGLCCCFRTCYKHDKQC